MAVISKIVESIHLNVTNVGHSVAPLPEALAALHPHLLDDTTFAALVMEIRRCESDLILRTTKIPADIIQWLCNHFEGRLIVYLGNEELYAEVLGRSSQVIRCMIEERCTTDKTTCDRRDWPIQLLETSKFFPDKTLVMGSTDGEEQVDPATRIELYSLRVRFNKKVNNNIISVAKEMLSWILEQKIEKGVASDIAREPTGFVLSCPDEESISPNRGKQLCIEDLLASTPTLLHRSTGERIGSAPIFRKPTWDADVEAASSMDTDFDYTGQQQSIEDLLHYFPAAEDLLTSMQGDCSCRACQQTQSLVQCKQGCKRYGAIAAVCTLLCHAVAEGFGARDAAEHLVSSAAVSGVLAIFGDIVFEQAVRWDTWFKVVACVIQGCDWTATSDGTREEGGTCWIGTQYGSLVVTAAWLETTWPFNLSKCFSAVINEGSISGIDEIASIVSEQTVRAEQVQLEMDAIKPLEYDFKEEFVLFRAESECFRRMSIVTAGRSIRVVDVAAKMNHLSRSIQPTCKHPATVDLDIGQNQHDVKVFQLPEILKSWGRETYQNTEIHTSEVLNNAHQVAVVLALAYGGAVLWNLENCCWRCVYNLARRESLGYVVSYLFPTRRLR